MNEYGNVLWIDNCPICKGELPATQSGPDSYTQEGSLCDYADPDGCFKHYHDKCFDQHECPAHKKKAT